MKSLLRTLALALALVTSLSAQDATAFMKDFRAAMKIGATKEMEKLVKSRTPEAIVAIVGLCEKVIDAPSDQVEEEIAAFRKAWKGSMGTDFVNVQYEYFSLIRPEMRKQRAKLLSDYRKNHALYLKAIEEKGGETFNEIGLVFDGLANGLAEVGDYYRSSQSWLLVAACFDEANRGKDGDLKRACSAYRSALEMRDKVELKDSFYNEAKIRFDHLEYEGYGDPAKGPEARRQTKAAEEAKASFDVDTTFEMFPDLGKVKRPIYFADEAYQIWNGLYLQKAGSTAIFHQLEQGQSPKVVREGASSVLVDGDGDGTPEMDLPMSGRITPVELTLGHGEEKRGWGFLATTGKEEDLYQGIKFNLAPADSNVVIYIAPAASVTTVVGETPIRILDDNMDGIYGSFPLSWQHIGTANGGAQFDFDSVVVDGAKTAKPWSEVQKIGDTWYKVEAKDRGKQLTLTPTQVPTGKMKLSYKGPNVDYLIVKGELASNENYYFNLMENKSGVEVPEGRYQLVSGRVSKGKRQQIMKALILPGERTPSWNVVAGQTTTVELGAPFGFDFEIEQDDETVTVIGSTILVSGRGHETYQRLWNCTVKPEISIRPAGKSKGSKGGKMRSAETQEQVNNELNNDYKTVWFPIDETNKKKKSGPVEVQLTSKKNKLFGKIVSDWKD